MVNAVLFLSEKQLQWHSAKIPLFTQPILQKAFIRIFHVLGQVAEKDERGRQRAFELGHVFDLDVFSLVGWWWGIFNQRQEKFIELVGVDVAFLRFAYLFDGIQHLINTLFGGG